MKYLENAFKFLGKYYLLLIPLFIATVIPAIINAPSQNAMTQQMEEITKSMLNPGMVQNSNEMLEMYSTLMQPSATYWLSIILSLVLTIIVTPATYGMVNKALSTGNADLSDFVPEMKNNIVKYIIFGLASIVLGFGIGIAILLVIGICVALFFVSPALGGIMSFLLGLASIIAVFVLAVWISFWFIAMVSDELGVLDALKKSISVAKSYFWPIVGINILVGIGYAIVSGIFSGIFGKIPLIGPVFVSVIAVLYQFVIIAFMFEVYRDKTGKSDSINQDLTLDMPGDYL